MTALDPDLKYKMDSRRVTPALGTHGVGTVADRVIQGDLSIAKYFLRSHPRQDLTLPLLGGSDFKDQAQVDEWVEYVLKCKGASSATSNAVGYNELLQTLDEVSLIFTLYHCQYHTASLQEEPSARRFAPRLPPTTITHNALLIASLLAPYRTRFARALS